MPDEISTMRRAGEPFSDPRAEEYAQSRAAGSTISLAAQHAGIHFTAAKRLEGEEPVRLRLRELRAGRKTHTTRSRAWILEAHCRNAELCAERAKNAKDRDCADLVDSSTRALIAADAIMQSGDGVLGSMATPLPMAPAELRAELRRRLSAPITTEGESVKEAAQ